MTAFKTTKLFIVLTVFLFLTACGTHTYHQVRPGDTLYSVSFHYGHDFQQVARWNNLGSPYVLHVGEWLRVAPPTSSTSLPSRNANSSSRVAMSKSSSKTSSPSSARSSPSSSLSTPDVRDVSWQWPVNGPLLQAYDAKSHRKKGIAIGGTAGTPVQAAAAGKIVYAGDSLRGYGNLIIIKHNEKFLSAYAHNQTLLVKEGQAVAKGQAIARMGNTESPEVKLHFEVRINGKPVDPLRYLPK